MIRRLKFLIGKEQFRKAPIKTAARLATWRLHCWLSTETTIHLENTALNMCLPPHWHGHPKLLYTLGWKFDPELPFLAEHISDGAVVFDIGANLGTWSLILSEAVGRKGRVFAWEPTEQMYDNLSRNISLNAKSNIHAFHCALSSVNDTLRLYHDLDSSRNSLGKTRNNDPSDYEDVRSRRLDDLASELQLEKVDFIKIDVEGAEALVFEGGRATLGRFKPAILFEINPEALAALGSRDDSSWSLLADLGYCFYYLRSGKLEQISARPPEGGNFWALHPESASSFRPV